MTSWRYTGTYDGPLPDVSVVHGEMWLDYGTDRQLRATPERMRALGFTEVEEVKSWHWLESTVDLQREAYGDHDQPKQGEALADSVMMNATALASELHEALAEVGWKPWATPRGWLNRDAYIGELVDVGHFLANLLVAVGCTDEEWEERYRAKQVLNLRRQRDGYDGVSTKCPECHRALDDVGIGQRDDPTAKPHAVVFCCGGCDATLDTAMVLGLPPTTPRRVELKEKTARVLRDDPPPPMPALTCPVCHSRIDASSTAFRAPELICDGTVEGCKMPDLAS